MLVGPGRESFDVRLVNEQAYSKWIRGYRGALWSILALLVATLAYSALYLSGRAIFSRDPVIVALAAILVIFGGGGLLVILLAYVLRVTYRPGGRAILVDSSGLRLEFSNGAPVQLNWQSGRFTLRISSVRTPSPGPGLADRMQIAIQSIRHPHFELTKEAYAAVVHAAYVAGLKVERVTTDLPGGLKWERTWVRRVKRGPAEALPA